VLQPGEGELRRLFEQPWRAREVKEDWDPRELDGYSEHRERVVAVERPDRR
jgi:hypothetical protein